IGYWCVGIQAKVILKATEWVKGKQMEEVLTIKNTEIAKHLSLPPVKLHCSMLAEDAIKAAVKDYETKRV
nr:iron-sulfur cluster assembly protein 1-like [Tanacetum cinerariifolium]